MGGMGVSTEGHQILLSHRQGCCLQGSEKDMPLGMILRGHLRHGGRLGCRARAKGQRMGVWF